MSAAGTCKSSGDLSVSQSENHLDQDTSRKHPEHSREEHPKEHAVDRFPIYPQPLHLEELQEEEGTSNQEIHRQCPVEVNSSSDSRMKPPLNRRRTRSEGSTPHEENKIKQQASDDGSFSHQALEIKYEALEIKYKAIEKKYEALKIKHEKVEKEVVELRRVTHEYKAIEKKYEALKIKHEKVEKEVVELRRVTHEQNKCAVVPKQGVQTVHTDQAVALPREERSVQSIQLTATSGNSNVYTFGEPPGRANGVAGIPRQDGLLGRNGERGDTVLQGLPCPQVSFKTSGSPGGHTPTEAQAVGSSAVVSKEGQVLQVKKSVEDIPNLEVPASVNNLHNKAPLLFPTSSSGLHDPVELVTTVPERESQLPEPDSEDESQQPEPMSKDAEEDYIAKILNSPLKGKDKHARCTVCFEKKKLANSHIISQKLLEGMCGKCQCIVLWEQQEASPIFKHPADLTEHLECSHCDSSTSDLEGISAKDLLSPEPDIEFEANILHVLFIVSRFLYTRNALQAVIPTCNRGNVETFLKTVRTIRLHLLELRQGKVRIHDCLQRLSEFIPKNQVLEHVYTKESKYSIVLTSYNACTELPHPLGSTFLIYLRVHDCCWGILLGKHTAKEIQLYFSKVIDSIEKNLPEPEINNWAMVHKTPLQRKNT